jgi:hypothetical protein
MSSFLTVKKIVDLGAGSDHRVLVGRWNKDLSASGGHNMTAMRKHVDLKVDVNFSKDNGATVDCVSSYVLGQQYGELPEVTSYNGIFLGWHTRSDRKIDVSSLVELSDTELYSRWEHVTVNDGTFFDVSTDSTYNKVGIYSASIYKPTTFSAIPDKDPDWNPYVEEEDTSA